MATAILNMAFSSLTVAWSRPPRVPNTWTKDPLCAYTVVIKGSSILQQKKIVI